MPRVRRARPPAAGRRRSRRAASRSGSCRSRSRWPGCASAGWPRATATCSTAAPRMKDYTTICSSAPSEVLALIGAACPRPRPCPLAPDRRREPRPSSTTSSAIGGPLHRGSGRAAGRSGSRDCVAAASDRRLRGATSSRPRASCCCRARSSTIPATTSGSASGARTCRSRSSGSMRSSTGRPSRRRRARSTDRRRTPHRPPAGRLRCRVRQ